MESPCEHLAHHKITRTKTHVCEDCIKTGDKWVHLRLCMECGHVGCCDSSKNKHATKHPVIRSIEPGETWTWCLWMRWTENLTVHLNGPKASNQRGENPMSKK